MPESKTTKCFCGEVHEGEEGHHCPEWDFMFVRPTDKEMEACYCGKPLRAGNE